MVKFILRSISFFFILLIAISSCSKSQFKSEEINANNYKINKVLFHERKSQIDTSGVLINTINIFNRGMHALDTSVNVFDNLFDSLSITLTHTSFEKPIITDSIGFKEISVRNLETNFAKIVLALRDTAYMNGHDKNYSITPIDQIAVLQSVIVNPNGRHTIHGHYRRINYLIEFDLEYENISTGHKLLQNGNLIYSRVSHSSL